MIISRSAAITHADELPRQLMPQEKVNMSQVRLPVHVMRQLSQHLTTLASREQQPTAAQKHVTHQLLSLAITLDLANQNARETYELYSLQQKPTPPTAEALKAAYDQIHSSIQWLENPSSGVASNHLSHYLKDATQIFQPGSTAPYAITHSATWTGNIAPPPLAPPSANKEAPAVAEPTEQPAPESIPAKTVHNSQSIIYAPILSNKTTLISPFEFNLKSGQANEENTLNIYAETKPLAPTNTGINANIQNKLNALFDNRYPSLEPYHKKVSIVKGASPKSNTSFILPCAIAIEASIQKSSLKKNLYTCAGISPDGQLIHLKDFWKFLQLLRQKESGGTLIIAPKSKQLLTELIALREPEFFLHWEIFTAENLDDALTYSTASDDTTNQSSALFKSIQELETKMSLRNITTNQAVRERLTNILELEPNHFSAECLLLQGSLKQTPRISNQTIGLELSPILDEMTRFLTATESNYFLIDEPSITTCKSLYEKSSAALKALESFIPSESQDIYKKIGSLSQNFQSETIARKRVFKAPYDSNSRKRLQKLQNESRLLIGEIKSSLQNAPPPANHLSPQP